MSERTGSGSAAADVLSAVQFQDELRRVARFDVPRMVENPLTVAVQKIQQNPAFTQSRLLTRILTALTYQQGEFRKAEASALDTATLSLVINLINACSAGTTARTEWVAAVDAVKAAQRNAGG